MIFFYFMKHDPSFEQALQHWPEQGQQVTYIGLKHCPTKFQIYWNGAISCFVGISCFKDVFPTQRKYAERYLDDQLQVSFGFGSSPQFHLIDSGQVNQSLLNNYLPITITEWQHDECRYELYSLATTLNPQEFDTVPEQALCLTRIKIKNLKQLPKNTANIWLAISGYKCLIWPKELPEDGYPEYRRYLRLEEQTIIDDHNRIRLSINSKSNINVSFYNTYQPTEPIALEPQVAQQKGLFNNLLHIELPLNQQQEASIIVAIPYFPIEKENSDWLTRDFNSELNKVIEYWEQEYQSDTKIITPEPLVNDFYKTGLQHTYITTDKEFESDYLMAKTSPAWYETIWANAAMATAIALDYRGHTQEAEQYLTPFLHWQGVIDPPNMVGASKSGFFAPPAEYSAIPWVSNHGWILWGLAEHYHITKSRTWLDRVIPQLISGCDWIIRERNRTKQLLPIRLKARSHQRQTGEKPAGYGLLPAGTVSDDKGSGQYLSTDAHCYRGIQSVADILQEIKHTEAARIKHAAQEYLSDIQAAVTRAAAISDRIRLDTGNIIPYVPNEIQQTKPPAFSDIDFWPYINYVDVGPLHLVDAEAISPDSDIVSWILQFEEAYTVAKLAAEISIYDNWCYSIKKSGNIPAHLLRYGVSVIEPFYAPQATVYFWEDEIDKYLEIFYNQLAAAISHRTLTPVENRFGVWNLPWADAEYFKMLRRMLVQEKGNALWLLNAIPRAWLADGKTIQVQNLPTYFGQVNFKVSSEINYNSIFIHLTAALRTIPETIRIRIRHPLKKEIQQVIVNRMDWKDFTADRILVKANKENEWELEIKF